MRPPSLPKEHNVTDITSETIQKVLDIARPEIHDLLDSRGKKARFSTKPLHEVQAEPERLPAMVSVSTLAGLADLIKANLEGEPFNEGFLIHVESETCITVKEKASDEYGRRLKLIEAKPVEFARFKFGQWMSQEEFTIAVASMFSDTPDKAYILNMASSLTNDATSTSEDDGFTQRATVKAGLRLKSEVTIKPRVSLAPFRTFPEVGQPVSEFVFRARTNGDSAPMLMLVEADGGRWKVDAIATLRKAVEAFNLGLPVIA